MINVTKVAIPLMREQRSGHIIQFSSVGGRVGAMGRAAYSAAKWGVEGFSEVLAKETAPLGIKVTIIEPGGFRTDFAGSSRRINAIRPSGAWTAPVTFFLKARSIASSRSLRFSISSRGRGIALTGWTARLFPRSSRKSPLARCTRSVPGSALHFSRTNSLSIDLPFPTL